MDKKKALKNCFITAPIAVNIEPLRKALEDRKIHVKDALSLPSGPGSLVSAVESAIRDTDFVCAVLVSQVSPNVLFEVGLAYGAQKPLFLVVDKDASLPTNLREIFYVRASPLDSNAIEFNLDNFLEHHDQGIEILQPHPPIYKDTKGRPYIPGSSLKGMLRTAFESLNKSEGYERGLALEKLVADLFAGSKAVVSREKFGSDTGADMAAWIDDIESSFGNPILIQVKSGRLSEGRLREAELQLQQYLIKTRACVGLLIYLDQKGRRFPSVASKIPIVLRFDVRDFADLVTKGGLAATLIGERNKVVHGRV